MKNAPTLYFLEKVEIERIRPIKASLLKVQNYQRAAVEKSGDNPSPQCMHFDTALPCKCWAMELALRQECHRSMKPEKISKK